MIHAATRWHCAADGRDWVQWVFVTDDSAAAASPPQGDQHPPSWATCPLIAICLAGGPTAVDWLPPSAALGTTPARPTGSSSSSSSRAPRIEPRQPLSFVVASNLLLQSYDAARGLWVAEAHSTAAVHVVSGSDVRVRQLSTWAQQQAAALDACRVKVQHLVRHAEPCRV